MFNDASKPFFWIHRRREYWIQSLAYTERLNASAVYAVVVCLSVTRRYCIETVRLR